MSSHHPLHVAIFVYDLSATGVVRNAIAIANRLSREGHRVDFLTSHGSGPLASDLSDGVRLLSLLPWRLRSPRWLQLALTTPRLNRALKSRRPDVLLSAGNHAHLGVWAAAQGIHGLSRIYRLSNEMRGGRGPAAAQPIAGATRLVRWWLERLARDAKLLVAVSPHLVDGDVMPPLARRKTVVVPNGVPLAEIERRASEPCNHPWLPADDGAPTLVSVGRLTRQKNHAVLIEALALANRVRQVRLVILGGGCDGARSKLLRQAQCWGVADCVSFAGVAHNPFPYIASASAFVLPSRWEGNSNALLEALACNVPVISSRTAGPAVEVLDHGRYGLLVSPTDAVAISAAILRQIGPNAVRPKRRAADFDATLTTARYVELIEQTASGMVVAR